MLTPGAYFVAVAADPICVNRSTLTGSIGVILTSWGFDRAIDRFDIDRRVFTAGAKKDRLDMFLPLTEDDEAKTTRLLDSVHQHFIGAPARRSSG
jgi:protease-4